MRLTLQPIDATLAPAHPRRFLCLLSALLFTFTAVLAHAQEYTSIVIFGDSLSDTGNVAYLTEKEHGLRIPGPGPLGGTTPMAASPTVTTPSPLRKSTSVYGLNSSRLCCRPSPLSGTRSTAELTTHTALRPPGAVPRY